MLLKCCFMTIVTVKICLHLKITLLNCSWKTCSAYSFIFCAISCYSCFSYFIFYPSLHSNFQLCCYFLCRMVCNWKQRRTWWNLFFKTQVTIQVLLKDSYMKVKFKVKAQRSSKLRVCASCEWIFKINNINDVVGCPKCGFWSQQR